MKKGFLILGISILLTGCVKDDILLPTPEVSENLKIENSVGIKLETAFVTDVVSMNVKLESAGSVSVKILDITNRVVSKETMDVKAGDNILKIYTKALPSSAYRIGLYDSNGVQLGITDFNKL